MFRGGPAGRGFRLVGLLTPAGRGFLSTFSSLGVPHSPSPATSTGSGPLVALSTGILLILPAGESLAERPN